MKKFLLILLLIAASFGLKAQCTIEVSLDGSLVYGDELTWTLLDGANNVVLSGGPYGPPGWSDLQNTTSVNPPYTFQINTSTGTFCDNDAAFTVTVGGVVDLTGTHAACSIESYSVGPCPSLTCPNPTGLSAITTLPDMANLSWTTTGAPQYYVEYRVVGAPSWTSFAGNPVVGTTASLSGLSPDDFEWRVLADCGADSSNFVNGTFSLSPYPGTCASAGTVSAGISAAPGPSTGGGASNVCFGGGATNANWYSYTPTISGIVTITSDLASNTAGLDTRLSVYTGTCAGLTCLASNDDNGVIHIFASTLSINVCAGTTYFLEWDDRWSPDGFDFSITENPTCTDPSTATISVTTDGFDATTSWTAGGGTCGGGYEWEVVADGAASFSGNAIFSGTGSYPVSLAAVTGLTDGTPYDLYVRDVCAGPSFSFPVLTNFTTVPLSLPSTCATAQVIGAGLVNAPAPTGGAGASNLCAGGATNSVWYEYTAGITGSVTVSSDLGVNTGLDTRVSVHTGTCAGLTCLGFDDDGGAGFLSVFTFNVCSGTTYYIEWDDRWGASSFDFELTETAACVDPSTASLVVTTDGFDGTATWTAGGGTCGGGYEWEVVADGAASFSGNAIFSGTGTYPVSLAAVTGLTDGTPYDLYVRDVCAGPSFSFPVLTNFTTVPLSLPATCATAQVIGAGVVSAPAQTGGGGASNLCVGGATNSVWYEYTAPVSGTVTLTSDFAVNTGLDTRVSVHSGTCAGLTCIGFDDDAGSGFLSVFSFAACAGTTYYIEWDDRWGGDAFDFELIETPGCAEPSALFAAAATLDGLTGVEWLAGGAACGGSYEWEVVLLGDAGFAGNDVLSGSGTYPVLFDITGLASSTDYELYVRDDCGGGSFSNPIAGFFTTLSPPPVNDDCANAIVVYSGYTVTGFSTDGATGTDITSCTFNDIADVWFSYTPTCDVTVEINSCGSTYDTNLSVWDACGGGTELACNDDASAGACAFTLQSFVSFAAIGGTTYYIRVAGFNGATGDINFSVIETTPCPCTVNVWTGSTSSDWSDATNWSCGVAPTNACGAGTDNVIIPAGSAVTPVVAGSLGAGNVEVATGSTINITGTLDVCGDVLHNGSPIFGGGALRLSGTAAQSISGNGTFENLFLSNAAGASVLAGANVKVSNSVWTDLGALSNNGSLTLLSTAAGTAHLNPGAGSFVGNLTQERFVTPGVGLGQRYFGSAVSGAAVVGLDNQYASPAYPDGQLIPDNCDPNILALGSPYSNLFEWHEDAIFPTGCSQEGWFAIDGGTALTPGRAYSGWMNDGSVLRVTGSPNNGAVSYGATSVSPASGGGWHLLSNPYPSPMFIDAALDDGFTSPQYYNASSGAFSGTFQPVLLSGTEVPIMQGFVAQSSGNAFTPDNSYRSYTNNPNFFKDNSWFNSRLDIELMVNGMADATYLFYSDNNTAQFDAMTDCLKKESKADRPTLYTRSNGEMMSLNGLASAELGTSVPMGVIAPVAGTYTFSFDGLNSFPANTTIYVEDLTSGEYYNVANGPMSFTIDPSENGTDRFMIHYVLPVAFTFTDATCESPMATLQANVTDSRMYAISNNANAIMAGSLTTAPIALAPGVNEVSVTDAHGGVQNYSFVASEVVAVSAVINASTLNITSGESIDFSSASVGATNYTWFVNGVEVASTEMLNYTFESAGEYEISLEATNNSCDSRVSQSIVVADKTTGIHDLGQGKTIGIYGANGDVNVKFTNFKGETATVSIFNLLGQNIAIANVAAVGTQTINAGDLASGYYIVKVQVAGTSVSSKLVLTKK